MEADPMPLRPRTTAATKATRKNEYALSGIPWGVEDEPMMEEPRPRSATAQKRPEPRRHEVEEGEGER
jgi:hypothetical protein